MSYRKPFCFWNSTQKRTFLALTLVAAFLVLFIQINLSRLLFIESSSTIGQNQSSQVESTKKVHSLEEIKYVQMEEKKLDKHFSRRTIRFPESY